MLFVPASISAIEHLADLFAQVKLFLIYFCKWLSLPFLTGERYLAMAPSSLTAPAVLVHFVYFVVNLCSAADCNLGH